MKALPTAAEPVRWPLEAIWQAIEPTLPGFTVELLPEIDSTNSELMRRFHSGTGSGDTPEPLLLVAEQQTAGRGRLGRQWQSRRGASLMFSIGLPLAPADWSGLSLAVGVSLADSLEPLQPGQHVSSPAAAGVPGIGLKWPNDLWLTGAPLPRKLGGVLVETASHAGQRFVVIGVGINIEPVNGLPTFHTDNSGPGSITPGCLKELQAASTASDTLLTLVPPLVQAVQAFAAFGFAPFQARFARRDVLNGLPVQLSGGDAAMAGTACGVAENGALLVHTSTGMKEITSSEVSVRPRGLARGAAL